MKENEEIAGLFRRKLDKAELPVNDGFWEELERDLPASGLSEGKRRIGFPSFYRIAAAASVVLVLGMASAAFWYFSPKEEMEEAFTQVAALAPGASLDGDRLEEALPRVKEVAPASPSAKPVQASLTSQQEEEDGEQTMSVHVSIRVTQQVYGGGRQTSGGYRAGRGGSDYYAASSGEGRNFEGKENSTPAEVEEAADAKSVLKSRNWALKAYVAVRCPRAISRCPSRRESAWSVTWANAFRWRPDCNTTACTTRLCLAETIPITHWPYL